MEAGFEVPQRAFAPGGLVDRRMARAVVVDVDEERRIAAVGHPALDLDLATEEVSDGIVDGFDSELDAALARVVLVVVTMLGGLAVSTVFTVFVIPALLMFFIKMEKAKN
mgnify:CR=1 FL=1